MTTPDHVVLELRNLARQVEALCDEHQHLHRRLTAREDRRIGAALLPLVADLVADERFTAATLAAAALNDRSATGQALRELIGEYSTEAGGLRAFGRLLQRLDGVPLGGCRLVPAGGTRESSEGLRWRVGFLSR